MFVECMIRFLFKSRIIFHFRWPVRCDLNIRQTEPGPRLIFAGMMEACDHPTPIELQEDNKELPAEGMMFVGDKGKILAGFNVAESSDYFGKKMDAPTDAMTNRPSQEEQSTAALSSIY